MKEETIIRISVRSLVEFILREGDIDNRVSGSMEKDAMLLGGKIHRKIQSRMGTNYTAEVPLKIQMPCDGFVLQIEGRADGVLKDDGKVLIDEIKGILRSLEHLEAPVPVHLAQAKCYAYIYAVQNSLKCIDVQMTYCQMETEEIRRFCQEFEFQELQTWFQDLVTQYEKWAKFEIEWRNVRNDSIWQIEFPFPYREGQRDLVASVYRTILRKKKLFIQAPTGVGKTMATVFPAVRAVGEGLGEKIFYLTAKTIMRTVAEQAFSLLKEKGLLYKTITLTAKEKICFCEEAECNPDACPYAKGHFDRVNDAVFDLITHSGDWSREVLEEQAKKHMVCPFEMSLDVSNWADAVICDYNYAFDPQAHLKRFFSESGKGEYLFLIDEAHNLVERGREMYSASLYKEDLLEVRKLVKAEDPKLAKGLSECNQQFLELKRECEHYQILKSVSHIALKLMNVLSKLEDYLEECKDAEKKKRVLDFYFAVRSFLNIHDIMDENYVIFSEMMEDGRFQIKLFCVNPAVNLQNYLEQGNSTIFFSATLLPVHYYKKLLSVEKDDYAVYAHSSFPQENKFLFIGTDVSTRYTRRGESTYQRFARYIAVMAEQKKGNYMAFFPSYRFLEEVHTCFLECVDHEVDSICQVSYMDEEQREEFLEEFEQEREKSLVAFCVMGGIFSEGIDLTDDKLIGAVIAGTGLPQVCTEREILKQYFNAADMDGFDYAYLYPGMNKVLQSAGRVIRTESDRGVILLLDDRFRAMRYREVFPREWQQYQLGSVKNLEQEIRTFWESP
ncbi:helicase C-terminal domain-containing protein [Mediterraneibacter gnavus]|uniref:DNA 5'-3' helicase n=1 Tax=Mediterraneibacter gnavus TaxID=33038 RepID=A0A9X3HC35_MEDGN|nr:helicase C-terminal domain-containing protein [Mediterraneibacter gnavus]MCZ7692772.1 ATP-dependent DNA helicase [Mediterraneibacter gnavus]MCZ7734414.1 ATP-dependent DNA helicase [Mediterraneibacter gnavus]MDC6145987.1 helicase C-terminal domain-containing protein [Mediterraneibacter gnavus]MDE1199404.1 helicase C-terminal domain-containing protein [Mediterraneibacter gnavus]